ncbi:hypothetical protein ABEB36_003904 [Hypothenemus hampei]|uniref:Uncharacterized protein n=1 Tax=Hypothenemus hampei TaxID=57062 RepID=A0ABD1F2U7_HYPHA
MKNKLSYSYTIEILLPRGDKFFEDIYDDIFVGTSFIPQELVEMCQEVVVGGQCPPVCRTIDHPELEQVRLQNSALSTILAGPLTYSLPLLYTSRQQCHRRIYHL